MNYHYSNIVTIFHYIEQLKQAKHTILTYDIFYTRNINETNDCEFLFNIEKLSDNMPTLVSFIHVNERKSIKPQFTLN